MKKIIKVEVIANYSLFIEFGDGVKGVVDLSTRLFGPVFEPLKDEEFFAQVRVDEYGAVCWPNGADLAPDALYRQFSQTSKAMNS